MSSFILSALDALIPSRKRAEKLRNDSNRLEAFLRAIPFEYCGWSKTGLQAISSGFCAMIDVLKVRSIEDIQDALNPGDAAALETLYENLVEYGKDFELTIYSEDAGRVIKLVGKRGALSDATELFNVIWAFDVTQYVNKINDAIASLEKSETREREFQDTLNSMPMPIWILNEELNITWVNKHYSQVVSETAASVIADQKELPYTSADEHEARPLKVLAQRAIAQNRMQSQPAFVVMNNKRTRVDIFMVPMSNGSAIGCAVDVSRIEELESEMRHFKDSNFEVLEQLRTGIAIYDADMSLAFYNASFEQLWGLDSKWLNKKPKVTEFLDKLRENRKLPEQANFVQYKQDWVDRFSKLIDTHEEVLVLPDGTMLRMVIVPQPRGGLLTTFEDVTSRYELETSYNTLVAVQEETLNNLAEGLCVVGEDGRVKLHNPTFIKLWDLKADAIDPTKHVNDIFDGLKPHFTDEEWKANKDKLVSLCFNRQGEKGRVELNDGRIYAYRTIALPDGNVLLTFTDISNSVKVEQALMEKNTALEAAEKLKTDFLANVSYQLRTPLNAMMGFTEILNEEYFGSLNDRQKGYTENMIQAGHRLITLVDNILDLSTIEAGYLTLNREDISIKEAVDSVAVLTKDWARREGIEISVKCPKNIGRIIADERRFKQVMLHLIRNAIDYTAPGGTIAITAKKSKDTLKISVKDSGIGIPEEDIARIFRPFERSENKDKKPMGQNRHSGAGLGLSLVKHIVELHGGEIELNSKENEGTEVTCAYPLSANQND